MSPVSAQKTYEEHLQYLYDIVRLKLWFVWWWHKNHQDESFHLILRNRVDIYRKTDINRGMMNPAMVKFDDPKWLDIERRLSDCFKKHASECDALQFEREGFLIVQPTIDARARRDYEERPYVLDYQCGSLKYGSPGKDNPKRVCVHIANAIAPRSIFDDKKYLSGCFFDLMERSTAEHGADSLGTHSWLNSYPQWLKLFPSEWNENMEADDRDVRSHFGFWGQFINARGTFNHRLGWQLRETGNFPYWPRYSWCSFESLRKHLLGILSDGMGKRAEQGATANGYRHC